VLLYAVNQVGLDKYFILL